jgi:hypothetical protein
MDISPPLRTKSEAAFHRLFRSAGPYQPAPHVHTFQLDNQSRQPSVLLEQRLSQVAPLVYDRKTKRNYTQQAAFSSRGAQIVDLEAPLQRAILDLPAPLPPNLTVNIIEARAQADEDNRDQEFEDVPLSAPRPNTPDVIPSDKLVASTRKRRSKKQPRTVNLNGLPIRLNENGTETRYREAAPPEDTYA